MFRSEVFELFDAERIAGVLNLIDFGSCQAAVEGLVKDQHETPVEGVKDHAVATVLAHEDSVLLPWTFEFAGGGVCERFNVTSLVVARPEHEKFSGAGSVELGAIGDVGFGGVDCFVPIAEPWGIGCFEEIKGAADRAGRLRPRDRPPGP